MSIQFGKINNNIFVNSTATYENGIVSISSPENAEKINFYAPSNANDSDLYEINGKQVILSNILNNNPDITWVKGAPISAVYDSQNNKLFINSINGENSLFSNLFRNANAQVVENKVVINSVEEAVDLFNFYSIKEYSPSDIYEVNGQVYEVVDLQGNKLESGWNSDVPVSLVLNENKLWYSSNGSDTKLPSDLSPLCPNFRVERNGGKVKISADKIQLNPYTNMVQGGVWAWGKTRPTKPTGENTKQWSRAELITTGKPYDGLYLGDVTPSDAVTETLIYLPENDGGSVKLVPFLVLSTDYLGGVYVMRKHTSKDFSGLVRNQNGSYFGGGADVWITNTYLNSVLGKNVSSALLDCEITTSGVKQTRKCWIPGMPEVGSTNYPGDGEKMPYFTSDQRRIAYDEDTGTPHVSGYWTRTQASSTHNFSIGSTGKATQTIVTNFTCYRPSFVLPKDFKIQQRPDGSYTVWNEQGLMKLGDVEPSTKNKKVSVNITEVLKSGNKQMNAPFVYAMKDYNGSGNSLMVRDNNLFVTGAMNGPMWSQTNAYQILVQYSTMEHTNVTAVDRSLHSSIRAIIKEVSVKSTDIAGALHDDKASCFLLSTSEYGLGDKNTGNAIPYYSVQENRIHKNESGVVSEGWTRDAAKVAVYNYYFIGQDGQYSSKPSGNQLLLRPCFAIPPTTPIRQLADGSYDLVPDDPALATLTVSTLAEEEEVPLEIELDWPEGDPLIARQWVYNQKGVYQTMLLGGVASTEDAPAYSPVLANNTWEMIAQACADRDPILDSWLVGDEKDEVINGETLTFVIVGKDHDDLADGSGKAPLTFGMKNLMAETRQMNATNTNTGSFAGSEMYTYLNNDVYNSLPIELRNNIKNVKKQNTAGNKNTSVIEEESKIWLFSLNELGDYLYAHNVTGVKYQYYASKDSAIKKLSNGTGDAADYWTINPDCNTETRFWSVSWNDVASEREASSLRGVCFGFCI